MVGKLISHYRIAAKLGEGGMGEVFRAEDTRLGRAVALKLLPTDVDEQRRQRFLQEARAASALNHPNIITIYDAGEEDGRWFIAMELVEGETLRQRLERGPLELKPFLRMAVGVAEGLARAHAAGITHRDIKPENIMITREGLPKLLDFGVAKLRQREQQEAATLGGTFKTAQGVLVGTLAYMSPEQLKAGEIDHRSDLFSFGTVLYECLTRQRPFGSSTMEAMIGLEYGVARPIRELDERVPQELQRIIEKLLEKDPEDRYQNASDLAVDLRRFERRLSTLSAIAPAPPLAAAEPAPAQAPQPAAARPRRPWPVLIAALAAGAVLGVLATLALHRPSQSAQVFPVTHFRKTVLHPTISPDGRLMAFVSQDQIFVALAASGETTQLTQSPGEKAFPRFSPDGTRILFATSATRLSGELWEISALGGAPRRLLTDAGYGVWSPDGSRLAFTRMRSNQGRELYVGDARGNNPRRLAEAPGAPPLYAAWTPDGRRLVYIEAYRVFRPVALRVVSVESGASPAPRTLLSEGLIAAPPAVSADGRWVYYSAARGDIVNLWRAPIEGGQPEQVTFSAGEDHSPTFSRDGQLYFVNGRHRSLLQVLDSRSVRRVADEPLISEARLSPDGKRVAFVRPARSGTTLGELLLVDGDGSNLQRMDTPGLVSRVQWSRDGKRIAFSSRTSGRMRVHVLEPESGKTWQLPAGSDSDTLLVDFGPKDQLLLDRRRDPSAHEVLVYDLATGRERALAVDLEPFGWSADGKWFGLRSRDMNAPGAGLFLVAGEGGQPQKVYAGAAYSCGFHPVRPEILVATRTEPPQFVAVPIGDGHGGPPQSWSSPVMLQAFVQFGSQALQDFHADLEKALVVVNEADMDIFRMQAPR